MKKKIADEIGKAYIRLHCLHEWEQGDICGDTTVMFSLGSRLIWVCKKCGKKTLYPNYF